MDYMEMLSRNAAVQARRRANVALVATITNSRAARAAANARRAAEMALAEDSADFRAMRALMHQRTGVCG